MCDCMWFRSLLSRQVLLWPRASSHQSAQASATAEAAADSPSQPGGKHKSAA